MKDENKAPVFSVLILRMAKLAKFYQQLFRIIGDAGAFVDLIFSHGIQAALYAGSIISWVVESSFKRPNSAKIVPGC